MSYSHLHNANHYTKPFGELHVIVPIFNPNRYITRYNLLKDFIQYVRCGGATVWIVELAFADRPFEIEDERVHHAKFRTDQELWLKESLINQAIRHLPHDWQYVAWIDGDITFANPFWKQETIHQLQHFCMVQMFHTAIDLDPEGKPLPQSFVGFIASMMEGIKPKDDQDYYYYYGKKGMFHPGYAWAIRREAWNTLGGLIDINIVGGGDHQMARGLYGKIETAIPFHSTAGYRNTLLAWQKEALKLNKNVGFVPGTILHHYHGKKVNRGYFNRWEILAKNKFDPITDLKRDWQGLWMLTGHKPKLRDDLIGYFRSRQEDDISH